MVKYKFGLFIFIGHINNKFFILDMYSDIPPYSASANTNFYRICEMVNAVKACLEMAWNFTNIPSNCATIKLYLKLASRIKISKDDYD